MDLKQLLDLPSRQARILKGIWLTLPLAITLECWVVIALAVKRRHHTAAFVNLLANGSHLQVLALGLVLIPLVVWTAVFWWRRRRSAS